MRKEFVFHLYNVEHDNFMKLLAKCPEDKRTAIPEGFNTSLYWHLGHVVRITEFHVYGLSQQTMSLPEKYKDLFHYGTSAKGWTEEQLAQLPAWDTLIEQLKEQRERIYNTLKDRLEEAVPENFKKAESFGELILTTGAHLSNHNGVVAAMLQVLQK
ncbi:DinB family protein [Paenibacillus sp. R14(2021)]|uniref:DinB family protein n=1 Tax=Paenibacillus sp. R14(2021) TaxID=2859228 RepID=UPI001C61659C|nr:DinB family protein [Paenibacillus sp. R14(2021)]